MADAAVWIAGFLVYFGQLAVLIGVTVALAY